jgi:hypothetical protein
MRQRLMLKATRNADVKQNLATLRSVEASYRTVTAAAALRLAKGAKITR